MSDRYLRPGTPHFVITLEDSMAVGGHFYSMPSMKSTLRAMMLEHYFGGTVTNSAHPQSPIALVKLLDFFVDIFDPARRKDNREVRNELWSSIDRKMISYLCLTIYHLDQLEPEHPEPGTHGFHTRYWRETPEFKEDFEEAKKLTKKLVSLLSTEEFKASLETAEKEFQSMAREMGKHRYPNTKAKAKVKLISLLPYIEDAMQREEVSNVRNEYLSRKRPTESQDETNSDSQA